MWLRLTSCHFPDSPAQTLVIALFIFSMALVGMFYPYNRGAMLAACVVLYALTAGISGGCCEGCCCIVNGP